MGVGLSFLPATLGRRKPTRILIRPHLRCVPDPPAFICHDLAISTTVEPKGLVCPALSNFYGCMPSVPLSSSQGDGIIAGNFCSLPPCTPQHVRHHLRLSGTFCLIWAPSFLSRALPC